MLIPELFIKNVGAYARTWCVVRGACSYIYMNIQKNREETEEINVTVRTCFGLTAQGARANKTPKVLGPKHISNPYFVRF